MHSSKNAISAVSKSVQKNILTRVKELHKASGRYENNAFVVEGRKIIEQILLKGYSPLVFGGSLPVLQKFSETIIPDSVEFWNVVTNTGQIPNLTNTVNIHNPIAPGNATSTGAVPWPSHNGKLVPPSSSSSLLKLDTHVVNTWKHAFQSVVVLNDQAIKRISQLSSSPGLFGVFPLLRNIVNVHSNPDIEEEEDRIEQQQQQANRMKSTTGASIESKMFNEQWKKMLTKQISRYTCLSDHPLDNPFASWGKHTQLQYKSSLSTTDQATWSWKKGGLILAGLSDPGNVGALIRSAAAFGVGQVVLIDCVDVYNMKTIMASAGSIADPLIVACNGDDFVEYIELCKQYKSSEVLVEDGEDDLLKRIMGEDPYLVSLVASGGVALTRIPKTKEESMLLIEMGNVQLEEDLLEYFSLAGRKPWLVVGSEAHGIPTQIEQLGIKATIQMPGNTPEADVENIQHNTGVGSLNAAVAGSLGCFVLTNLWR